MNANQVIVSERYMRGGCLQCWTRVIDVVQVDRILYNGWDVPCCDQCDVTSAAERNLDCGTVWSVLPTVLLYVISSGFCGRVTRVTIDGAVGTINRQSGQSVLGKYRVEIVTPFVQPFFFQFCSVTRLATPGKLLWLTWRGAEFWAESAGVSFAFHSGNWRTCVQ